VALMTATGPVMAEDTGDSGIMDFLRNPIFAC
jgi:hypothetical protein